MDYVTGASGFIGSHLVKALQESGREVIAIPHQEIHKTKLRQFDHFFFLSAYGNMNFQTETDKTVIANLIDPFTVIRQAIKFKFKSFIFMSTSSVNLRMQTAYSRTKRAAEEMFLAYLERTKLPICIIRPYSITGIGEQKEHLIPTLIRSCLEGELMNFVAEPTHDFIDVEDVVSGLICLSDQSVRGIYELGTGKKYTNDEVRLLVEGVTGKKANINLVSQLRIYDNDDWVSGNFKARGYGWLPVKKLGQSIKEMVEAYEQSGKKNN